KNIDIVGFFWGSYRRHKPQLVAESFSQLFRWFEEGRLKPHVSHTLDFSEVAQALDLLKTRKSTGKVVLTMGR
ncbi:MAG TPA: zinc-binding dehydrogenase, partial [Stellaceae bacterium]